METAAVSPAIGSLLEIAVKNIVICQPGAMPAGFGREFKPILAVLTPERSLL
jgi:hypothetical protein